MTDPTVIASAIGGVALIVASSIAAVASLRAARHTATRNGVEMGDLVEDIHREVTDLADAHWRHPEHHPQIPV